MSAVPITPRLPLDTILCGDALSVLRTLPDNSIDAIVTDPPAGISFMGKHWDSDKGGRDAWIAWLAEVMTEAWRVIKPGGHALVWALPRTSHWTAMALEDAGFEIRDCCTHLFGAGFPKSLNVSKAIDKAAGAKRKKVGSKLGTPGYSLAKGRPSLVDFGPQSGDPEAECAITAPATDAAQQWDGWGTALKPAAEFWWLCRKPLAEKTVAANVLRWGTGALNIDGSRVPAPDGVPQREKRGERPLNTYSGGAGMNGSRSLGISSTQGRWPANLLLSHAPECGERGCSLWCPVRELDRQSGVSRSPARRKLYRSDGGSAYQWSQHDTGKVLVYGDDGYGDSGGASRYFTTFAYVPKASRSERNRGCSSLPYHTAGETTGRKDGSAGLNSPRAGAGRTAGAQNHHPTVKPLALMSWLIRLITPPGGIVLDPFAGSGSTLCAAKMGGWRYLGIEREAEYVAIAEARLGAAPSTPSTPPASAASAVKPKRSRTPKKTAPQLHLLEEVSA